MERLSREGGQKNSSHNQATKLAALSTFLEKLERYQEAKESIEKAIAETTEGSYTNGNPELH